jgi:hypothetical protein
MMLSYAYLLKYHPFHLDLRMVFYLPRPWLHFSLVDYNPCLSSILCAHAPYHACLIIPLILRWL